MHNHKLILRSLTVGSLILIGSASYAHAQAAGSAQMQMLPPTSAGSSAPCTASNNLLVYGGVGGQDRNGYISAINCITYGPSVTTKSDPGYAFNQAGDFWLGSPNPAGITWTSNAAEYGPALHLSGATGWNSDDFFFQRYNRTKDISELHLVIGDNPYDNFNSNDIGDAFVIGVDGYGSGFQWIPRFTFTSSGYLGVNTTNPTASLEVDTSQSANIVSIYSHGDGAVGDVRIGGNTDFTYDGGNDSLFYFINTGAAGGATNFFSNSLGYDRPLLHLSNQGSVSIGTIFPMSVFHVVAPTVDNNMTGELIEEQSSQLSSPRLGMVDTSLGEVTAAPAWYIDNLQDNFRVFRQPNIYTAGFTALNIDNNGNVATYGNSITWGNSGVGTSNPQARLDVLGEVKVSTSGAACTSTNAGSIRWTGTAFQGCDGNNWRTLVMN